MSENNDKKIVNKDVVSDNTANDKAVTSSENTQAEKNVSNENKQNETKDSKQNSVKKKSYLGQGILFAVLAAMIAPVLLGGGGGGAALRVGNSYIKENEIRRASVLAQQDSEHPEFFYWFFFLREESFYLNDVFYQNFGRSPFNIFGLTATKEQVDENLAKNILFQKNGQFDQDQYREILKRLGATDAVYREEVSNWIAVKPLFYLMLDLLPSKFYKGVNLDNYIDTISKAFTQKRSGSYRLATIDESQLKEPTQSQMRDYYTTHPQEFEQSAQAEVMGVRFDNLSDTDIKGVIEELRAGVSYKDVGQHLDRNIFRGVMKDNRLYSGDNLSSGFAMRVAGEAKPDNVNRLSIYQDVEKSSDGSNNGSGKGSFYVYMIVDYTAPILKKFEEVQEELKEKVLLKQKLQLAEQGKAKLGDNESFAVELKDVLPEQYPNFRSKDRKSLSPLVEKAGWEIFQMGMSLDQRRARAIVINDKVYVVSLTHVTEQLLSSQEMEDLKRSIKQSILSDMLGLYVDSIARYYGAQQY